MTTKDIEFLIRAADIIEERGFIREAEELTEIAQEKLFEIEETKLASKENKIKGEPVDSDYVDASDDDDEDGDD